MFSYVIDNNNLVKIYTDTQTEPVIIQPNWPNGTPWASSAQASDWAQACINAMSDPLAPYAPSGPGLDPQPKPSGI
jgi:hypothetical protein